MVHFIPKLKKIEKNFKSMVTRDLTPLGKVTIVKCLGMN